MISAEMPPERHPSSTTTTRWVFASEAMIVVVVERTQRPQIDDLGVDTGFAHFVRSRQALTEAAAVGEEGDIASPARHPAH